MNDPAKLQENPPILIFGICRRSGTNFLAKVLLCHRDCGKTAPPLAEDYLLRQVETLGRYARRTSTYWKRRWGSRKDAQYLLEQHLGYGLLSFIRHGTDSEHVVSKTPSTINLDLYPRFIPEARVVVLLRDGRSVTESLVQGFRWTYERAIREWRQGARAIMRLQTNMERDQSRELQVLFVRYEDLIENIDAEIDRLLQFLALDRARFDFEAAHSLPVFGSSYAKDDAGKFKWHISEKPKTFDPLRRYQSWPQMRHERFSWLAADEQTALGYDIAPSSSFRSRWIAYNWLMNILTPIFLLRDGVRTIQYRWRERRQWRGRMSSSP